MNITNTQTSTITIPDSYTFTFTDSSAKKTVTVFIDKSSYRFVVWSGSAYDSAGDYTQSALTAAVAAHINSIKVS